MFKRTQLKILSKRITEKNNLIQVLAGPRQTGKTTLAKQLTEEIPNRTHYASADEPTLKDPIWIEQQWEMAKEMKGVGKKTKKSIKPPLLILDEIQKIENWSEIVKKLWDRDQRENNEIRVLLLGSSPLLIKRGLTESLTGRFELTHMMHWSYSEMQKAFDFSVEEYIFYGGYPGAAPLRKEFSRWADYVKNSLIEPTISKDIMLMTQINKPVLLRRLFELGSHYSGQVLSYQKMLGQLHDAGNTTTLAHYLDLLGGTGLLFGLQKYSASEVKKRGSSPKFLVANTGLLSAQKGLDIKESKKDTIHWGRLVESAVGAHLVNSLRGSGINVLYWSDPKYELDFVLQGREKLLGIEVKSSLSKQKTSGLSEFKKKFNPEKSILVGAQGVSIEKFLEKDPLEYF